MSMQVRVNDLVLDASAELGEDGQKKVVIIDGHGKALSLEDKQALIVLSRWLERQLNPYRQPLPAQESFLVQVVLYWSEAPVGWPLKRTEDRF